MGFFCFLTDIQPLEVTDFFIIAVHPSAELHSCSLSSGKEKKKKILELFCSFSPPPPGCIRKSGIKSLSSPPWLLYCQSERSDGRKLRRGAASSGRRARCSLLAAFPHWGQVRCSWNNKSRTFFNLRVSEPSADGNGPVLCLNSEEFLLLKDLLCDHQRSVSAFSKCNRLIPLRANQWYFFSPFFFKHLNISLIKTSWMVTDFLTEMPDWLNRWNKYAN